MCKKINRPPNERITRAPPAAATAHRRCTTFHLASRRGRAAPGVLIVPLRGTIGETGIINPTFDACGAETWGFGISCVSDALPTPCRRDTRRPTIHLPRQTCVEDAQADKAPGFGALLRQTWGKQPTTQKTRHCSRAIIIQRIMLTLH